MPIRTSLTLNQSSPVSWGQSVTFTSVLPKLRNPVLIVTVFKDQRLVFEQRGLPGATFTLGGPDWPDASGQAVAVANVYDVVNKAGEVSYMVQAVTTFTVED
jgi:hypothetical protein